MISDNSSHKWSQKENWSTPFFLDFFTTVGSVRETAAQFREELLETHTVFLKAQPPKNHKLNSKFASLSEYLQCLTTHPQWANTNINFRKLVFVHCKIADSFESQIDLTIFKATVDNCFRERDRSLVCPGDMVGVVAAQSISERFTQTTLNSFHLAGSHKAAAQQGISRITEIFNATTNPKLPYMRPIIVKDPTKLLEHNIADVCKTLGVKWDVSARDKGSFSSWVIVFKLQRKFRTMYFFNKVGESIQAWLQTKNDSFQIEKYHKSLHLLTPQDYEFDRVKILTDRLAGLNTFGIPHAVEYDQEHATLYFKQNTNLVTNFGSPDKLQCFFEATDYTFNIHKLESNDIHFMTALLGIEAARAYLIREIKQVLGKEGISVNTRHIMLVVDNMTSEGHIRSNKYHGMDVEKSVILKATFQQATETFMIAASKCMTDNLEDISGQILLGKRPQIGTACVETYTDRTLNVKTGTSKSNAVPKKRKLQPTYLPIELSNPKYCQDHPLSAGMIYVPASPSDQPSTTNDDDQDSNFLMPALIS